MEGKQYKKYLGSADSTNAVVEDIYFNNVILLISGSATDNTRGFPFSRDYSRYQRHVKNFTGTVFDSAITYPTDIPPLEGISSCIRIPNNLNHVLRAGELNLSQYTSTTIPSYIDVMLSGWSDGFTLGAENFTIEISFFTDAIRPIQTIFSVGTPVVLNPSSTIPTPTLTYSEGYGLFLINSDLFFRADGTSFKINTSPLVANTFYSVGVQRVSNRLWTYLNFSRTNDYGCNFDLSYVAAINSNTETKRLSIGSVLGYAPNVSGLVKTNLIDSSFSGGISNFRITENIARYPTDFYSRNIPFPKAVVANRIDANYSNVLFNLPLQFDSYNYAPTKKRLENSELRKTTPNFNTGFIELDGETIYTTEQLSANLSTSDWTIEGYIGLFENNQPITTNKTLEQWLANNISDTENVEKVNLIKLTSNGALTLNIDLNFYSAFAFFGQRIAPYLSFSCSEDGLNYKVFPSETNNRVIPFTGFPGVQDYVLPATDIIFYNNSSIASSSTTANNLAIASPFSEPNTHFAVSRSDNNLYFYLNGVLVKTVSYSGTLYQEPNKLELSYGSLYTPWVSNVGSARRTLGVKGIKVTNLAKYVSTITNNFFYEHCLQPLPLALNELTHPKARILTIVPVNTNPSISTATTQWYVYVAQPFDNLVLADFTLSQIEGVTGASLVSIQKNNELEYLVTANTGSGNGKLGLNFLDRQTVKYRNLDVLISNYLGELSFQGEYIVINKNAPVPTISSGSSPYINETFTCTLTWDAAIVVFDITKIGVSNGVLSNLILIDEVKQIYQFNITPDKQGVVYIQALEGAGITDGNISSAKSNLLARIYSEAFPILQLPLDLSNTFNDVSPNQYRLDEIIPNNTLFSSTVFPIGTNSSLSVVPQLEQSGLAYEGFEAIGQGSSLVLNSDWTIEFNYRGNTFSPNNTTHILSVEKSGTGFAILAINGDIRLVRSIDIQSNLFPTVTFRESDIFSGTAPIYPAYENATYTLQQKFPHFAITKKGNVYRFYRNGIRIGLVESSNIINISSGYLRVGYYENRVTEAPYFLSNVRLTVGKALYTAFQHDIPIIPYQQITNILEVSELLDYISIVSDNAVSNKAINGNTISLIFKSIINLTNLPEVTILGKEAEVTNTEFNTYVAKLLVDETIDQQVYFDISISGEPSLPNKNFTNTTNNTSVFIENSPFTIVLSTNQPNDNSYKLYIIATLNKSTTAFGLEDLTLNNCIAGGFVRAGNSNVYTFEIQALTSGDFSISVAANTVASSVGTLNQVSNTLTRTAIVPAYIPDSYFVNTLLFLQPTGTNIVDESQYECDLVVNNVSITNEQYPTGLLKSMKFNGQGSGIVATLPQALSNNQDYCIEFYIYLSNLTTFSLSAPIISPASSVTTTSFDVNWGSVSGATDYVLDISKTSDFSRKIDGFDNTLVGNVTTISVDTTQSIESPLLAENRVKALEGFVAEWNKVAGAIGYKVYTSLSSGFTTSIRAVSNLFTRSNNISIEDLSGAIEYTTTPTLPGSGSTSGSYSSNSILQGILSSSATAPKIFAFNDENTIRCYKSQPNYTSPMVAEDIEPKKWFHLALINHTSSKSTKLYIDGVLTDKLKNTDMNWNSTLNLGYAITNFNGYMTGFRVTYGQARYLTNFEPPTLPLPKD